MHSPVPSYGDEMMNELEANIAGAPLRRLKLERYSLTGLVSSKAYHDSRGRRRPCADVNI
jgi:hypothetical protein